MIPALENAGYIVPGIELAESSSLVSEVRYFRKDDKAGAADAVMVLRDIGLTLPQERLVDGYQSSRIRPCHYEAWFAAGIPKASPTVMYYRDSDRELVQSLADKHSFKYTKGTSKLND